MPRQGGGCLLGPWAPPPVISGFASWAGVLVVVVRGRGRRGERCCTLLWQRSASAQVGRSEPWPRLRSLRMILEICTRSGLITPCSSHTAWKPFRNAAPKHMILCITNVFPCPVYRQNASRKSSAGVVFLPFSWNKLNKTQQSNPPVDSIKKNSTQTPCRLP